MNLSSSSFQIVTAGPGHAEALVRLVESVYRGESSKRGWTTEADLLEGQRTDVPMILEMMSVPQSFFYVIPGPDEASLIASVFFQNQKNQGYLGMLAVDLRYQNLKLGRKLLLYCEEQARHWGLSSIKITVIEQRTELIAWYERCGYRATGGFEAFPEDLRYGRPKVKDLKLKEFLKILS